VSSRHPTADALERSLGDPANAASPISFARAVEMDEAEEFPADFVGVLRTAGVFAHLIPAELGGSLRSFEHSLLLLRLIARRDLTTAIAFGQTFLGAIPVWLAGSEAQKQALAARIRDGELGCLALTEEAHGGDLLACEFAASRRAAGYALSGRKWLINNGSRGGTASVYARTGEAGPSAFSLFLIDKRRLDDPDRFAPLPKVRTLGIRGADISGFECRDLPLPESAVIGTPGRGYELTLKTLQVSRTMCAALSLGAGDTALRAVLDFALHRRIFNDTVAGIPSARDQLVGAYADLLIAECLGVAASRALVSAPDRMAVWSSIVKYLVPTLVEESIRESATVLGARYYLRQGHHDGIFQKCLRDNAVVGLFDGSTAVNLHIISGQLPALGNRRRSEGGTSDDRDARLRAIFDARQEAAWSAFPRDSQLTFTNNGFDEVADGLLLAARAGLPDPVSRQVQQLAAALAALDAQVAALQHSDPRPNSPARADLARRYCLIHAGGVCVLTWLHSRGAYDRFFDEGPWLAVCLQRLLRRLTPDAAAAAPDVSEAMFTRLRDQFERQRLFSLRQVELAGP
jgi:alkylation response protein AidB-like acyl-CoA dehydrogenase